MDFQFNKRLLLFRDWEKNECKRERFLVQLRREKRSKNNMKNREIFNENEEKKKKISKIVIAAWENKEKEHFNRFALKKLIDLFVDSKSFIEFWNSGVFQLCMELINSQDKRVLVYCSELLADLTVADPVYCEEMVRAGIFKHFQNLLANETLEVVENTCWALNNIILDSPENSAELSRSDLFSQLLNLAFTEKIALHSRILFIFVNLSQNLKQDTEKSEDLMKVFIHYIQKPSTFNTCLAGLAILTENNKDRLSFLFEKFPEIIEKTTENISEISLNAAHLLLNFSVFERFTEELLSNKIIPIVRVLIKKKEVKERLFGFSILKNLINSSEPHFCLLAADSSLLHSLVDAILDCNKEVKVQVWNCLETLCNRLAFFHEELYEVLLIHSAAVLPSEKDPEVFMSFLEAVEAILRNSGSYLNHVLNLISELDLFDMISKNLLKKNLEISGKVEFLLSQYCC
jgi:hypothetical protein